MPVAIAGKSSATITAAAAVVLAAAAYLGLATKVICPGPASSIPVTPVISASGSAFSSVAPSAEAISASFIVGISRDRGTSLLTSTSPKQRYLTRVFWTAAAALRFLVADDSYYRHFRQRRAGHKNPLRVGARIGRNNGKAVAPFLQQIVGHHALNRLVIAEAQPHPQSFHARPRSEGLAGERFRITEFANEVNALDLAQLDGNYIAGRVQQLQLSVSNKRSTNVTIYGVAVHLADDHFLVCGGHRPNRRRSADCRTFAQNVPSGSYLVAKSSTFVLLFVLRCPGCKKSLKLLRKRELQSQQRFFSRF